MVAYIKAISLSKHLTQFPLTYKSPVAIIFKSKDFCPWRSLLHWYCGNRGKFYKEGGISVFCVSLYIVHIHSPFSTNRQRSGNQGIGPLTKPSTFVHPFRSVDTLPQGPRSRLHGNKRLGFGAGIHTILIPIRRELFSIDLSTAILATLD